MKSTKVSIAKWFTYSLVFVVCVFVVVSIMTPGYLRARPRSRFVACESQLEDIKRVIDGFQWKKPLDQLDPQGDAICNLILAGYDSPEVCKGKVKEKIDQLCAANTFKIKVIDETRYEIKAQSRNEYPCPICVTEKNSVEDGYSLCLEDMSEHCVH